MTLKSARSCFGSFLGALSRVKTIDIGSLQKSELSRRLSILDLAALGIGSTLGAGIYVVAGQVAKTTAGPSVVLSFLIAAIASMLAALSYAEFGSRIPLTGSAYVYSYVSIGEFQAFVIGWNLILEYVIGTASVARAWSANFDALINKTIATTFLETMPMPAEGLGEYPDFFAFGLTLLLTVVLAAGVRESSIFNNIFTGINILVILGVIIVGAFKYDIANWQIDPADYQNSSMADAVGYGGFFPFEISGTFSGAATCFYAFVGFDIIATTAEEVHNPQRAIPISIVACLFVCFLAYCGVAATITLIVPFFELDSDAPLPAAFEIFGWPPLKYIIAGGSLCGLTTSLMGAMFPLPRILYAMATDGLLFVPLAKINKRLKTPLLACIVSGLFSGIMALLFDTKALVDMMSIGTLLAYTLVSLSIILLRGNYSPSIDEVAPPVTSTVRAIGTSNGSFTEFVYEEMPLYTCCRTITFKSYLYHCFRRHSKLPSPISSTITWSMGWVMLVLSFVLAYFLTIGFESISNIIVISCLAAPMLFILSILTVQPQDRCSNVNSAVNSKFRIPLVPWLPACSIIFNSYLMLQLSDATWIRFAVWMAVGLLIYFAYGIFHSKESDIRRKQRLTTATNFALEIQSPNGDTKIGVSGSKEVMTHF